MIVLVDLTMMMIKVIVVMDYYVSGYEYCHGTVVSMQFSQAVVSKVISS